jgi:hypothetical protein
VDTLIGQLAHWLFGVDPAKATWVHAVISVALACAICGPPAIKACSHALHLWFVSRATPQQLAALASDDAREPPKPPSIAGPAALLLILLCLGFLGAPASEHGFVVRP